MNHFTETGGGLEHLLEQHTRRLQDNLFSGPLRTEYSNLNAEGNNALFKFHCCTSVVSPGLIEALDSEELGSSIMTCELVHWEDARG